MNDLAYSQVNTIVRMRELELLSKEVFERMLQADSLEELREVLASTHYAPFAREADFIENIDRYLMQDIGELFEDLYALAPDKWVLSIYTQRLTFHNIKLAMKSKVTGVDYEAFATPDGSYPYSEITRAVNTGTSSVLEPEFMSAIQEVNDYMEKEQQPRGIDLLLDRHFFSMQLEVAKKSGSKELMREVIAFVDLMNLSIVERAIRNQEGVNLMRSVLVDGGTFSKEELVMLSQKEIGEFARFVLETPFKEFIQTESEDGLWKKQFSVLMDDYLTGIYQNASTVAFGPLPLLALLNAKEIEQKNIRLVVKGMRSFLPIESIRERMRGI
ncbi:V/A-type H+-transporting ATPase subunit C [Pilibacter termitis]|uniref:V/A-type H+-transporting ATPase subunit C n=1 Tax=Pilibacter termitis TaxID=263852 RepID=A0A1T4K4M5_9ENTE|nr:V-type ATPase subunit [Pilibacter termitis]SJZ37277.1 V/A-type H+-transporting ATPase subunit C [Pilibacter termitis]